MISNHDTKVVTFRDVVEAKLMEQLSGCLRKLDGSSADNTKQDEQKCVDYLELAFLVSGQNPLSISTYYPHGLLYEDRDGVFGVGVFFRSEKWKPSIHIVSPRGTNWERAVDNFTQKVWEHLPEAEIFIRYTFLVQCDKFQHSSKAKPIESRFSEDEIELKESS